VSTLKQRRPDAADLHFLRHCGKRLDMGRGAGSVTYHDAGGITENLPRILPRGCQAHIHLRSWPVPGVFHLLQRLGAVQRDEMFRTFNMGIGFILLVGKRDADAVLASLERQHERAYLIGEITRAQRGVRERVVFV
jgi:phosphoribosylaminoimidazole (AIR) synthetase